MDSGKSDGQGWQAGETVTARLSPMVALTAKFIKDWPHVAGKRLCYGEQQFKGLTGHSPL
jgi:hypothetical protein